MRKKDVEEVKGEYRVSITLPNGTRYKKLIEVDQDSYAGRLNLDSFPTETGLFSRGFASCFGIIMISKDQRRYSLAHVSSLNIQDGDSKFLTEEAEFVSKNYKDDYFIEIAICRSGYEVGRAPEDLSVDEFFKKSIEEYKDAFKHILKKEPRAIHELPEASMLILDSKGHVNKFEGLSEEEIEIVELLDGREESDEESEEEEELDILDNIPQPPPPKAVDLLPGSFLESGFVSESKVNPFSFLPQQGEHPKKRRVGEPSAQPEKEKEESFSSPLKRG